MNKDSTPLKPSGDVGPPKIVEVPENVTCLEGILLF